MLHDSAGGHEDVMIPVVIIPPADGEERIVGAAFARYVTRQGLSVRDLPFQDPLLPGRSERDELPHEAAIGQDDQAVCPDEPTTCDPHQSAGRNLDSI